MKCIKCGHELKDGAIYCIRCGAMQISMDGERLNEKGWSEVNSIKAGGHAREFKAAPEGNGRRIAIVIVVILVIAAIIAGVAFALTRPAPEEDEPVTTTAFSSTSSSATSTTSSTSSTSSSATSASSTAASSASASSTAASQASSAAQAATATQQPAAQPEPQPEPQYTPEPAPEPAPAPAPATAYGDQPSYAPEPTSGDYVLADSSSRYYTADELSGLSASELYYARNEIFARHGRMFHRSDLQSYFESKSWYNPTYTPAEWDAMGDQLSDVERQNSQLMMQLEESKNSGYL